MINLTRRETFQPRVNFGNPSLKPASTNPGAEAHPAPLPYVDAGALFRTRRLARAAVLLGATLVALLPLGEVQAQGRFVVEPGFAEGRADWLAVDGDLVAYGSGDLVALVRGRGAAPAEDVSRLVSGRAIDDAVLAADRLWIAGPDGLASIRIGVRGAQAEPVALDPPVWGALHLARSDDHLFVAEDGVGLRLVRLPGHAMPGHMHHAEPARQDALLEIPESFSAVAAFGGRAWLGLSSGTVIVVDVSNRLEPRVERRFDLGFAPVDLASDGKALFALAADGRVRVLQPKDDGPYESTATFEAPGAAELEVTGRTVRFAAGDAGVGTAHDTLSTKAIVNVAVGDTFFSPTLVTVNVGDTVQWNKPVTAFQHNVESCDGVTDPGACAGGVAADGLFRSGNATTASFTFQHVFANAGSNPYFCVIHSFTMSGRVDVQGGGTVTPPPVPDGDTVPGAQVKVNRLNAAGTSLSVTWDTTSCPDAVDYNILYGLGSQLPTALAGTYNLTGGACGIGTISPFTWNGVPDPGAGSMLWWVVVATDGEGTEGSWGVDAAGGERKGPGAGGASNQCAISAKDTSNTCGP
jgi:plastocyanin